MTAPIRQRVPLAASDERFIVRRSAARHDRAVAAAGMRPAHAGCGLIPLPRLSGIDHDDVTVVSEAAELDLSGTAVAKAQFTDARWQARLRSAAALTGAARPRPRLPQGACQWRQADPRPGRQPCPGWITARARAGPVIGMLTWFEAHDTAGRAATGTGATRSPVFAAIPVQPTIPARGANIRTGAVRSAIGAALRAARYERRRHVQPRHAHGLILGGYQRAVILAPCRTSGLRRGTLHRESRQS
jgi:hypothetical protein